MDIPVYSSENFCKSFPTFLLRALRNPQDKNSKFKEGTEHNVISQGVSKNCGTPKMDGENNGSKPY